MRSFHNAIFVKGALDHRRLASRLAGLWAKCDLREVERDPVKPDESVFEAGPGVRLTTNDPRLAAFFRELGGAYPRARGSTAPPISTISGITFFACLSARSRT